MANVGLSRAVPRFLLPGLSWQNTAVYPSTSRALSTVSSGFNNSSRPKDYAPNPRYNGDARPKTCIVQGPSHRVFHATARRARDHHFDTLKFVQRLKEEGFTETQSVAMMKVLSDVIEERSITLIASLRLLALT
jgi:hypothetical protein